MPSSVERPRCSQEALLRLEKGTASPTTQLNEAAQIIGLDLSLCVGLPEVYYGRDIHAHAAPKEEWVLRWLLKKLKAGKNYRIESTSFLLLRQLIDLIPPKTLATTLKDQKFLEILDHAITDLKDDVFADLASGAHELPLSDTESSLTLSDSPRARGKSDKKGTKRKRAGGDDQDAMDVDGHPRTLASCFLAFIRVLDCVYSLIMLSNRTADVNESSSSHLRHALRGEPQSIAGTLGKALELASVAVTQFCHGKRTTDLQRLLQVLPALLELWEWRSLRQDDSDQTSSNELFSTNCFQCALRLLHCVRAAPLDTDERVQVLNNVERLVALHVVLPVRTSFFARGGAGIDYTANEPDWSSVKPVSDAFRPILCKTETLSILDENKSNISTNNQWNTAELLPELFDIASRSVPRDTFRRQTNEAPWLETLFVAVAELAFTLVKSNDTPNTVLPDFVRILEQLFRVALTRNVQLSLHTLLTHAVYTGLLKEGLSQVEWSLTALLIKLGVDIFLPNSGLLDSNKYLAALLGKIILHWRSGITVDGSYETIRNDIVIPLLRGFTAARDLGTFMELWYQQLITVEEARIQDSTLISFTVWEDEEVCNVYGELMRNLLNQNIANAQMHAAAAEIRGHDGKIANTPGACAQILILESGLRNRTVDLTNTSADLQSVIQTIVPTLSSKQSLHWRWRLWKLARNLFENNAPAPGGLFDSEITNLTDAASKSIKRHHKDLIQEVYANLECFEAYQFILTIMKQPFYSPSVDKFNSLMGDVTKFVKSISSHDAVQSMKSPWDGRLESLQSAPTLALSYLITLARVPDVWIQLDSELRLSLLRQFLSLAAAQYLKSPSTLEASPNSTQFIQAWASVVCHEYLLNAPYIVPDLMVVLFDRLKRDDSSRQFYIEGLQRIPAPLISRHQRGVLMDLIQEIILQEDNSSRNTVAFLSLMARLADMPKSGTELTSAWEPIWNLAKAITLQGAEVDLEIMKAFRILHKSVIEKLLVTSETERQKMFKKMYKKVSTKASKLQSIDQDSMDSFFLRISLSQFWLHRDKLVGAFDETELAACREKAFDLIVAELRSIKDQYKKQKQEDTITVIKILDALEDFEDLAADHRDVGRFLSKIVGYVEKSADSGSTLTRCIRRRVLAGHKSEKTLTAPVIQCAETIPLRNMYSEEQQLFIRSTSARFRSMPVNALTRVVEDTRELGFTVENGEYHLLIAGLAISALPSTEDKESPSARELSLMCGAVIESIPCTKTLEQFTIASECLDILLRNHPRCISQWNVDSLLACIAVCASKSGPRINPKYAGTIYIRLCRLMGVLLGLHRQKLGGRFHLILPVMQRLLHCLFAKARKGNRRSLSDKGLGQQPHWLTQLQATHATHFTRLLTSLCDPTVSAVARPTPSSSGHDGLTDQTKTAKRIAGQYLQYLIMDYAQSSLRGDLSPDVKAALLPGLYSVLDVMSRDTMRALNASLDISSRAVFKGLYDDYIKFGKWNKG